MKNWLSSKFFLQPFFVIDLEVHLIMKELDENELNAADEEWKKQQNLFQPSKLLNYDFGVLNKTF